jgi:hypothetical protein
LIEPLKEGLHRLKSNPNKYKEFNPDNGWGDYEGWLNSYQVILMLVTSIQILMLRFGGDTKVSKIILNEF